MTTVLSHSVIRASAGTGKTFALSNRYLQLLRLGVAPEKILATTFTRKAAGEILERVMRRLSAAAQDEASAIRLARELNVRVTREDGVNMLRVLSSSLHRLSISTLDSFFHRAAASFRHELDLPRDCDVADNGDPRVTALQLEAVRSLLSERSVEEVMGIVSAIHGGRPPRSVTTGIQELASKLYELWRQTDEDAWKQLVVTGRALSDDHLEGVIQAIEAEREDVADKRWKKALQALVEQVAARDWLELVKSGLPAKILKGEKEYYGREISEPMVETIVALVNHVRHEITSRLRARVEAAWSLLRDFDAHYSRLRREEKLLLYSDIPVRLARGVASGADLFSSLYYRLDMSFDHLLLDEFQDTSLLQWSILRPMAEEISAHGDAHASGRSLFCVGDVKQAIYGWRGGCATVFDKLVDDLRLGPFSASTMAESYRSSQVILDTVNRVFLGIGTSPALARYPELAASWRDRFEAHKAHYDLPGYAELITARGEDAEEENPEGDEDLSASPVLAMAAKRIVEILNKAPGRNMGVLVRTNAAAHRMMQLLRAQGVDASGEGGSSLADDPAVTSILAALDCADHPGHEPAAFELAHSPLGAHLGLKTYQRHDVQRVGRRIRSDLIDQGYARVIAAWARALEKFCDERSASRLEKLVELAAVFDARPTLRPSDFARQARETEVADPAASRVRVMTVHGSKGLEFDIVFLPELHGYLGRVQEEFLSIRKTPDGPVDAVVCGGSELVRSFSDQLQQAWSQSVVRRLEDDMAVLYVAMTRAKYALHMIVPPVKRKKDGTVGASGWTSTTCSTILRRSLSALGESENPDGGETLFAAGDEDWMIEAKSEPPAAARSSLPRPVIALAKKGERPRRFRRQTSPTRGVETDELSVEDLFSKRSDEAAVKGLILHSFFEEIEWFDTAARADDALLDAARRNVPEAAPALLKAQLAAFRALMELDEVKSVLAKPRTAKDERCEVWRERSFVVADDDQLHVGRFDRVIVTRGQVGPRRARIVDFKTGCFPEKGEMGDVKVEHQRQLQAYRGILARMLGIDIVHVTAELLFLDAKGPRAVRVLCSEPL